MRAKAEVFLTSELSFTNSMDAVSDSYKELRKYLTELRPIGFDPMANFMMEKGGSGAAVKPGPTGPQSIHPALRGPPPCGCDGFTHPGTLP